MEVFNACYLLLRVVSLQVRVHYVNNTNPATENLILILKERIIYLFISNACFRAVAGIYRATIGQGKKFFFDVFDKLLMIASRQISSSNAVPEQNVAANKEIAFAVIKTEVPRRMAWRED